MPPCREMGARMRELCPRCQRFRALVFPKRVFLSKRLDMTLFEGQYGLKSTDHCVVRHYVAVIPFRVLFPHICIADPIIH